MTKILEFVFDFASPNVYLACKALPPVLERTGAKLEIIPCLLGGIFKATGNRPPWMVYADVKGPNEYAMLEMRRFIEKHNLLKFKMNPHFPPNTLLAMRALIAADEAGAGDAFIDAGLKAMWEDEKDISDRTVVADIAREAGLDANEILARTDAPEVKQRLAANTAGAVERGAFGAPTFFIGDEMFFGKERLGQVEAMLAA